MSMRNTNKRSGSAVDNEVANLTKKSTKGGITDADYARLQSKYDDPELVQKIQDVFTDQQRRISKVAKKFAKLVRKKYAESKTPFHILLQKALAYKKTYDLNESQFAEFKRIYEQELAGTGSPEVAIPHTNMMKVLGNITTDLNGFTMNISDDEYRHLQEIMNQYNTSKPLHAQVMLQSMQYRDCDFEAMSGQYHREHNNKPGEHVHPVVAAMFLPKIDTLEHHFLYSNLAGIVTARKNRKKLKTRPDYELFYSLITDPNDVVCDSRSPVADLLARSNLQVQLWNAVLHLRNGQYYNSSFREFITSVDVCRLNKHDNPDLIYGRFDGTVCKRLLSAFSFRPTVVATTPVINQFSTNPYHQNVRPQVRKVQMINLRLPTRQPNILGGVVTPVSLNDALSQNQVFLEGRTLVFKQTSLIYSRGVIFFYVDRRAHVMRVADVGPFNLNRVPYGVTGFERLNDRLVTFQDTLNPLRNDIYKLRSVVIAELNRNDTRNKMVVGSSTLLMTHPDMEAMPPRHVSAYFHYDPLAVIEVGVDGAGRAVRNPPVTTIPRSKRAGDPEGYSFEEMAQNRGTIFMYELVDDDSQGLVAV